MSFVLSCFLKRHCENSTDARATDNTHLLLLFIPLLREREREKTCKYIYSVSCKAAVCA